MFCARIWIRLGNTAIQAPNLSRNSVLGWMIHCCTWPWLRARVPQSATLGSSERDGLIWAKKPTQRVQKSSILGAIGKKHGRAIFARSFLENGGGNVHWAAGAYPSISALPRGLGSL